MTELRVEHMNWDANGVHPYLWPLNRLESKALYKDLMSAVIAYGKGLLDKEQQTILKILATEICLAAQAVLLAEKMAWAYRVARETVNIPEGYTLWHAAVQQNYKDIPLLSICNLSRGIKPSPALKKILRPMMYWNIGGFYRKNLSSFDEEREISCITLCTLSRLHQKKCGQKVALLSYDEWFYPPQKTPEPYELLDLKEHILAVAKAHKIKISKQAKSFLFSSIAKNMEWVRFYLNRMDSLKIPKELWLTSLGNTYGRILAAKVLGNGGRVVVHDHAEGGNFSHDFHVPFNEFQLTSEFITFTEYQAQTYGELGKEFVIGSLPKITSFSKLEQVFKMPCQPVKALEARSKKPAILYPCPLIPYDISSPCPLMSSIEIVDWQCRLFSALNQAGFQVHFKPHPLSKQSFPNYAHNFDIVRCNIPFEEAMQNAEQMVFDWTLTTTFGYALASAIPITVIDFGLVNYNTHEKRQLAKRCHWIPGTIDVTNRHQTDWKALIHAFKNPREFNL